MVHRTTAYAVYSPETYDGHWKQLTVRTTRTDEAMAMVFFNPQVLTPTAATEPPLIPIGTPSVTWNGCGVV